MLSPEEKEKITNTLRELMVWSMEAEEGESSEDAEARAEACALVDAMVAAFEPLRPEHFDVWFHCLNRREGIVDEEEIARVAGLSAREVARLRREMRAVFDSMDDLVIKGLLLSFDYDFSELD